MNGSAWRGTAITDRWPRTRSEDREVKRTLELLERLAAQEASAEAPKRLYVVMEAVRRRERATRNYTLRAARIGEMEPALADAKIAARVSGLISDGAGNEDVIGAIESRVEGSIFQS